MPKYAVVSPPWTEYVFRLDDGTGPTEECREYTEVEAPNAKIAKTLALREWRKKHGSYTSKLCKLPWADFEENPFTGMRAINLDAEALLELSG